MANAPKRQTKKKPRSASNLQAVTTCRIEFQLPERLLLPSPVGIPQPAWRETLEQLLLAGAHTFVPPNAQGLVTLDATAEYPDDAVAFEELNYLYRDLERVLPTLLQANDPTVRKTIRRETPEVPRLEITIWFTPATAKQFKSGDSPKTVAPTSPTPHTKAHSRKPPAERRSSVPPPKPRRAAGEKEQLRQTQLASEYDTVYQNLLTERRAFMTKVRQEYEPRLNAKIRERLQQQPLETVQEKSDFVDWINQQLETLGLAAYDTRTRRQAALQVTAKGECRLVAIGASNPSISRRDLTELLPLRLTSAGPRKQTKTEQHIDRQTDQSSESHL